MNEEIKRAWVTALRSGEYTQTDGRLHMLGGELGGRDAFCCLGVLCDLAYKAGVVTRVEDETSRCCLYGAETNSDLLPEEVRIWAGLASVDPPCSDHGVYEGQTLEGQTLSGLNDEGYPFDTIADVIEEEL